MSRVIKFRGQTRRKGEKVKLDGTPVESNWVYGGIFLGKGDFSIIYTYEPIEKFSVYTDTVSQFTGLHDKNGKEIYEGDIILVGHYKWKCKVVWDERCARFIGMTNDKDTRIVYVDMVDKDNKSAVEVVGNIYENSDLLNPQN